jgi:hypothetical protein
MNLRASSMVVGALAPRSWGETNLLAASTSSGKEREHPLAPAVLLTDDGAFWGDLADHLPAFAAAVAILNSRFHVRLVFVVPSGPMPIFFIAVE